MVARVWFYHLLLSKGKENKPGKNSFIFLYILALLSFNIFAIDRGFNQLWFFSIADYIMKNLKLEDTTRRAPLSVSSGKPWFHWVSSCSGVWCLFWVGSVPWVSGFWLGRGYTVLYKVLEGHGADIYDVLSKFFKPLWLFSVIFGAFMAQTWEIMAFSVINFVFSYVILYRHLCHDSVCKSPQGHNWYDSIQGLTVT